MSGYNIPSRALVSQQDSAMIERPDVPRSKFTGSWSRKTTFDAGLLIPFMCDEILPGDHMKYDVTAYIRMATPLFPMFDNQRIDTFFFFVPNRLVWSNWAKFMGEQLLPGDSIAFTIPQVVSAAGGFLANTTFDHFGCPVTGQTTAGQTVSVQSLPFRAYRLIYHQWFRDENLVSVAPPNWGDSGDVVASFPIYRRAKSHDYFTSALPWPQKFTAPTVAIGGLAPITGLGLHPDFRAGTADLNTFHETSGASQAYPFVRNLATDQAYMKISSGGVGANPQIFANLAGATGMEINVLRQAFLVQQLLERDARGGTRYTELVKSHFGVTSPDARLQRPEYIGGGSSPLNLTPVAQTATGGGGLGALGAAGTSVGQHRASYAATEHGFIIGIINVRTELSYSQGLHKMWSRSTRFDYYWPALAGLGEQAILRKEIYSTGVVADDDTVFGYQERWHEYRTRTSDISGMFRPTTPSAISQWHLSQQFSTPPTLGQTFIEDTPPMARVLAAGASTGQQYYADILISREATRPIPTYGTPAVLGRF